jgi:DNA (cytosine-5)-methyltransferase 1
VDHSKELTHISLCAGYGGIDLGLSRALGAVRTIAFVEIESFAIANLVAKIEAGWLDRAPVHSDLKTFPYSAFRGRVDILSGGFPCQPFSTAGRRAGDEDPRHLWPHITRGIKELGHPPLVFFENVEGIISSKLKGDGWADSEGTPVLLHVLRELERLDYQATAGVFSAGEVGAPHQRKRVFILGCRSNLSETGRGLVNRLLRDTERGRAMGNDSCGSVQGSCGRWRSMQKESHDPNREPSAGAGQELAYSESPRGQRERGAMGQEKIKTKRQNDGPEPYGGGTITYPAPRGADQYPWEPPRVTVGNANNERLQGNVPTMEPREREQTDKKSTPRPSSQRDIQRQIKPEVGRNSDGAPSGLDYAELCHTVDNRTDELRLLGNGVVPATAERAFRVLWGQI